MLIGGDDSVMWSVTHQGGFTLVRNREKRTLHRSHPKDHAVNVRKAEGYAEGRDPVDTDGKFFKITIRLPKGKAADTFLDELRDAARNPRKGKVSFTLPIRTRSYDQIQIDWPITRKSSA